MSLLPFRHPDKIDGRKVLHTREQAQAAIDRLIAQRDMLVRAANDLLAFGRPKEGSDRYKAAWDVLKATVPP